MWRLVNKLKYIDLIVDNLAAMTKNQIKIKKAASSFETARVYSTGCILSKSIGQTQEKPVALPFVCSIFHVVDIG